MDADALPFLAMRARVRPMGQPDDELPTRTRRRRWPLVLAVSAGLIVLAILAAWLTRERIAGSVIAGQLDAYELPAQYRIESIGPGRQVLTDVVIGDPARPDLTIERVETEIVPRFGVPAIGEVMLVRPRLYGRLVGGRVSFGSLDKLLYEGDGKQPFRLPDIDLAVVDGRGLVESEYGPVGVRLEGSGHLRGGFVGTLAAIAPRIEVEGCEAERATLFGSLRIERERPRFAGPLRLTRLECPQSRLRLAGIGLHLDTTLDAALDGVDGKAGLKTDALALAENRLLGAGGNVRFVWRKQALTAHYTLAGRGLDTAQAAAGEVTAAGVVRGSPRRIEVEGELGGQGVRLGRALDRALASAEDSSRDTLAAPLLGQMRGALQREGRGSNLAASFVLRRAGDATHLVVPQASLRGGGGATLLSVTRFQLTSSDGGPPRLSGNFATGGPGLPQLSGRLERGEGGRLLTRMSMPEYRAGDASIAVPRLTVVQLANGALGFAGEARLSGPLPGGRAENLQIPIEGNWSRARGLSAWRECTALRFDRLELANLAIERRGLTLCPPKGGAIFAATPDGTRIAAGAPALDLAGRLGATPIRIRSGPMAFAWPGTLTARALDVELGPSATASRFRIANLGARIGSDIAGRFAESEVRLAAVPLDVLDASGDWRFADGALTLSGARFRLEDRQLDDRFQPLVAQDGALRLADNAVTASAMLREPQSGRAVVGASIRHDLATGIGHADLAVDGLTFDDRLQPDTITRLALGVIANARGSVDGRGRIDWTPDAVTSTGRFTTASLDFAAAFGPVQGAAGTIVFTDLLGMVSAPDQEVRIASINPGIEVNDGRLTYELRPDYVLAVDGATWPFLGGTLTLLPVTMRLGVAEERRYTLMIAGLDAGRFVDRMDLGNITATGTFDGTLPLIFDENGGRIEGGQLRSRAPGGNVSYVGALTYEDLSTMANFAFDALKSLDYRQMAIAMEGTLAGEIITRVEFAGISQGAEAKRNFLTDRIARLPILFKVNVRAPFFQLASSFRSLSDPAYVRDPRTLGLIDDQGQPVAPGPISPDTVSPGPIQPSESEKLP
jgi:hypothetical protein